MKSRPELKTDCVGSKTRSIGQIVEKRCAHYRRYSFDTILMKLYQNICLYKILAKIETWLCWVKN